MRFDSIITILSYFHYYYYYLAASKCGHQDSFRCSYGECIPMVFKCDGISDCKNGKDEEDCPLPKSCQDWWSAGYQENGVYYTGIENTFLAYGIRISEILPWDRKSYLTHAILTRLSREGFIHWLYWNTYTHCLQVTSSLFK